MQRCRPVRLAQVATHDFPISQSLHLRALHGNTEAGWLLSMSFLDLLLHCPPSPGPSDNHNSRCPGTDDLAQCGSRARVSQTVKWISALLSLWKCAPPEASAVVLTSICLKFPNKWKNYEYKNKWKSARSADTGLPVYVVTEGLWGLRFVRDF